MNTIKYKSVQLFTLLLLTSFSYGQLEGVVYGALDKEGKEKEYLYGAEVFFKKNRVGKTTCGEGVFRFERLPKLPDTLIIRAQGYYSDTIPIGVEDKELYLKIVLYPDHLLEEVVIKAKRQNSSILRLDPRNTEMLGSGELRKAACCNLSESFETNATVDVNMADGVSGTKKISMMGLDGAYTQIQFENFPILQNLDLASGLGGIPGTWINSIQITKGTGTVVNGYESMAGLINLEYYQPDQIDKLYLNAYGSIQGRGEVNIQGGGSINDKWSSAYFLHTSTTQREMDRNDDGFRDLPIGEEYVALNRWKYQGDQFISQFGVKGNYSDKRGGQVNYRYGDENADNPSYGVGIRNLHFEAFGKSGWMFEGHQFRSLGLIYYAKYHEFDAIFGNRSLVADERRGYVNLMFEDIIGSTMHVIKAGASFVYDDLNQIMSDNIPAESVDRTLIRTEIVPGAYTEYTYTGLRTTLVGGFRTDYHNMFGWQHTPRLNYKYKITEDMDLRLTGGRGFRVPNYAIDNLSMMSSNLPWVVDEAILPEVSWNFGAAWYYQFKLFGRKASLNLDYYHTLFTNQLVVDRDENPELILFGNLDGQSFSNVVQFDFKFEPARDFEIKMAYKFLDVRATMGGELMEKMMVPRHRGFINMGYITRNKRWEFDFTASVFGPQRLAEVRLSDGSLTTDNFSGVLPMLNAQVTHVFKRFDFYVGGENLLDYRLDNPLIDAQNPFGINFDATRVWAPIFGINIYAGIRITLN
jgi:outer membrane receptor for ferrienterochelin and colicins